MSSEKLKSSGAEAEKPDWKVEREREVAKTKRRLGEVAMGTVAALIVAAALTHGAKTTEIMDDEARAKNVKKIEAEAVVFRGDVNARKEPFVDNLEPNQLAEVGEEGETVTVDYDGEVGYYRNEEDPNGGWYGLEVTELSDKLLEEGYISQVDAGHLLSDEKYGDGWAWFNEKYVSVVEADEQEADAAPEAIAGFGSES